MHFMIYVYFICNMKFILTYTQTQYELLIMWVLPTKPSILCTQRTTFPPHSLLLWITCSFLSSLPDTCVLPHGHYLNHNGRMLILTAQWNHLDKSKLIHPFRCLVIFDQWFEFESSNTDCYENHKQLMAVKKKIVG